MIDDSLAQCGLIANPSREGVALRDRFNAIMGTHPSLRRELAVRLSGLAIRYPAPAQVTAQVTAQVAGQRAPDLDLRGVSLAAPAASSAGLSSAGQASGPAATIFGLLHPAKFVLFNLGSAAAAPEDSRAAWTS